MLLQRNMRNLKAAKGPPIWHFSPNLCIDVVAPIWLRTIKMRWLVAFYIVNISSIKVNISLVCIHREAAQACILDILHKYHPINGSNGCNNLKTHC